MQCFTVFRTLGASARHHVKHAAHHLVAHHVHRAHHVIAHSVIGPVPIPAMVCILTGLAALGVGALVAEGMGFAPGGSKEVTTAVSTPAPNGPSDIGSLWASLSSFHPTEIGSLLVPRSSFDWNEWQTGQFLRRHLTGMCLRSREFPRRHLTGMRWTVCRIFPAPI